ncbi:MAG TPA: acyl carrier protein [Streptosporangiaceae bacterium]|jgi:acyl carrier protein|nr:acyl carrier protein [Streptosporangiaceae bacterium]
MGAEETDTDLREEIRDIVAAILEVDIERIGPTTHFWDELEADSLQGIEILSALERRFHITIEQSALADMRDVQSTSDVVTAIMKAAASHGS